MATHVRALAIIQIVYGSLGLLLGLLVFLVFGGVAAIVGISAPASDSAVAVPVLAVIGGIASMVLIVLSTPRLAAGIGLLQRKSWGRVLSIVVNIIGLIDVPFGTAIGIYGLWVLLQSETAPLFDGDLGGVGPARPGAGA